MVSVPFPLLSSNVIFVTSLIFVSPCAFCADLLVRCGISARIPARKFRLTRDKDSYRILPLHLRFYESLLRPAFVRQMPGVFYCGFFRPARRLEQSCCIAVPPVCKFCVLKHEAVKLPASRSKLRPPRFRNGAARNDVAREHVCVQLDDVRNHPARGRIRDERRNADSVPEVLEPVAQLVGNAVQGRLVAVFRADEQGRLYIDDPVRAYSVRRAVEGADVRLVPVAVLHNLIHERAVNRPDSMLQRGKDGKHSVALHSENPPEFTGLLLQIFRHQNERCQKNLKCIFHLRLPAPRRSS